MAGLEQGGPRMKPKKNDPLSSRNILDRIGISSDAQFDLLEEDDPLESPM